MAPHETISGVIFRTATEFEERFAIEEDRRAYWIKARCPLLVIELVPLCHALRSKSVDPKRMNQNRLTDGNPEYRSDLALHRCPPCRQIYQPADCTFGTA